MRPNIPVVLISVCILLWIWPNLIHEPLHWLAAREQGVDASITFDWSFPPHPSISAPGIVDMSIFGQFIYVLLPSIVSGILLFDIWMTRKMANQFTHIALPAYLGFDLIINMIGYRSSTSDFHFLSMIPVMAIICVSIVMVLTLFIIWEGMIGIDCGCAT